MRLLAKSFRPLLNTHSQRLSLLSFIQFCYYHPRCIVIKVYTKTSSCVPCPLNTLKTSPSVTDMVQQLHLVWLFGAHDNLAQLFLHCSDLNHIRNTSYKHQSIVSLYSTNSVNVYIHSDDQQFRFKIAREW